jgi:copper chaperone NosL
MFLRILFVTIISFVGAHATMYQTVPSADAILLQQGPNKLYCPNCGMNLVKFYKTSHAMKQPDGSTAQYCSLHCLVEANDVITPDVEVVDVASLKFIKAFTAYYVVGSDKPGTMSMNSKYAFANEADAKAFLADNGGQIMSFAEAAQLAADEIPANNKMIAKKREKAAQKGAMMVKKMCPDVTWPHFHSIAEAKGYVVNEGVCGQLDDAQYQAIAIYLNQKDQDHAMQAIAVPEDAKCPVCGMFVAKYPKWVAAIEIDGYVHYFDGPKDMFKFYFNPGLYHKAATQDMITKILVSDYYTLKPLLAQDAWYVTGSNVHGPMGNELIPFATREAASTFAKDHHGQDIIRFDAVTPTLVEMLN